MRWTMLLVIAALGAALPAASIRAAALATAPGNAARGKDVFLKVGCDQCHGREAQGSPITAPKLGPDALPYAAFELFVRRPRLQMPPYGIAVLSDADLIDVYAYVRSRPAPAGAERLPP
jgi:mono/diheme cytochrome c family protein